MVTSSRALPAVGVSLAGFHSAAEVRSYQEAARTGLGREPLFELSCTLREPFLRSLSFLRGSVLSVHAPCPAGEFFPNLGSRDPAVRRDGLEAVRRSAATAARFGARLVVLHPGYTLDAPVPVDPGRRLAGLAALPDEQRLQVQLSEGSICRRGYCATASYREHLALALDGLGAADAACRAEGVELAVENLNPRITYIFQLPSELAELARALPSIRLCVDLGHLWISSLAHGFGFAEGLAEILATGRVRSAHIHDNASRLEPEPALADDHALVGSGTVPIGQAVAALARAGVPSLVVETTTLPLENTARLFALLAALP
jgi:sugar phosphate isomerase/epimerase